MDEAVLLRSRDAGMCVDENEQHGAESLPHLTAAELDVYQHLKKQTWGVQLRLEQERIPWTEAWAAVKSAHERCL